MMKPDKVNRRMYYQGGTDRRSTGHGTRTNLPALAATVNEHTGYTLGCLPFRLFSDRGHCSMSLDKDGAISAL